MAHQGEDAGRIGYVSSPKCRGEYEVKCVIDVTCRQETADSLLDVTSVLQQTGGQTIEELHLPWHGCLELRTEHLEEQRVVTIGVTSGPGRQDELEIGLQFSE